MIERVRESRHFFSISYFYASSLNSFQVSLLLCVSLSLYFGNKSSILFPIIPLLSLPLWCQFPKLEKKDSWLKQTTSDFCVREKGSFIHRQPTEVEVRDELSKKSCVEACIFFYLLFLSCGVEPSGSHVSTNTTAAVGGFGIGLACVRWKKVNDDDEEEEASI